MHGKGVLTFCNGELYEGEFKKDKFDGQGKYTWAFGGSYVG